MKCLIFSVNCDASVIFPVPSDMGNSNKKKRKKMGTSGIIRFFFNSHSMGDAALLTHARVVESTENLGCVFKMTKRYGNPRIVIASKMIAGIAKFLVSFLNLECQRK